MRTTTEGTTNTSALKFKWWVYNNVRSLILNGWLDRPAWRLVLLNQSDRAQCLRGGINGKFSGGQCWCWARCGPSMDSCHGLCMGVISYYAREHNLVTLNYIMPCHFWSFVPAIHWVCFKWVISCLVFSFQYNYATSILCSAIMHSYLGAESINQSINQNVYHDIRRFIIRLPSPTTQLLIALKKMYKLNFNNVSSLLIIRLWEDSGECVHMVENTEQQ